MTCISRNDKVQRPKERGDMGGGSRGVATKRRPNSHKPGMAQGPGGSEDIDNAGKELVRGRGGPMLNSWAAMGLKREGRWEQAVTVC